ncbi:hypothetical protein HPB52_023076 [Rhipicephalus sanguineus]|uniref:Uncharacterized protein n=1 Tax=Rhipicephalus sanguineus TaxID=34632 RepID=A0A9D4TBW7_RHISA|nr:hypothetical protein HPB52_023076 [Rhipicephalus sanguineus]
MSWLSKQTIFLKLQADFPCIESCKEKCGFSNGGVDDVVLRKAEAQQLGCSCLCQDVRQCSAEETVEISLVGSASTKLPLSPRTNHAQLVCRITCMDILGMVAHDYALLSFESDGSGGLLRSFLGVDRVKSNHNLSQSLQERLNYSARNSPANLAVPAPPPPTPVEARAFRSSYSARATPGKLGAVAARTVSVGGRGLAAAAPRRMRG